MNRMPNNDPQREKTTADGTAKRGGIPSDEFLPGGVDTRADRPKLPALPAQMIVAIDGPARTGKNTAGELVAEAIGG